jgi:DNA-binding transcriptional LysR family regulator
MPNWENIRVFLAVARHGSFRAAALQMNTTVNTVRERVSRFEDQFGALLFTRHRDGVRLTSDGERALSIAARMEAASFGLVRNRGPAERPLEGEVRIGVTEGLGTFWLVPRLIEFQRAHPRLVTQLHCTMTPADVLRAEVDLAIQIVRPTAPELKVIKLGTMHIMLCASKAYINAYGWPRSKEEIAERHRIVMQYADQGEGRRYYQKLFPGKPEPGFLAMQTNVSSALYWSIVNGAGLGWVPTYAISIGSRVVPLDIDWTFKFDIWLAYHPDCIRIPRVKRMVQWVVDAFDSRKFPWFRDEFIHPTELKKIYAGPPLFDMFDGYSEVGVHGCQDGGHPDGGREQGGREHNGVQIRLER